MEGGGGGGQISPSLLIPEYEKKPGIDGVSEQKNCRAENTNIL